MGLLDFLRRRGPAPSTCARCGGPCRYCERLALYQHLQTLAPPASPEAQALGCCCPAQRPSPPDAHVTLYLDTCPYHTFPELGGGV